MVIGFAVISSRLRIIRIVELRFQRRHPPARVDCRPEQEEIKKAILRSRSGLSAAFRRVAMLIDDNTDLDKPFIKAALVQYNGGTPLSVEGALTGGTGKPVTVLDITPRGLKNLIDHPGVGYIDGGHRFSLP